jgi:hypothetical protein
VRKALVTIIDGPRHDEFAEITMPTFKRYAARHGYELLVHKLHDGQPSGSWSKAILLRQLIETYEIALWVDCDAAISPTAHDASVYLADTHAFQALPFLNYQHEGLKPDWLAETGQVSTLLSSGVWMVAQHPFAVRFLDTLLAQTDLWDAPAAEAAGVWRLLGADTGSAQMIADNRWLAFPTGTVLLNDRWNSRETANDPHIFHATWLGAKDQHELRLDLLRQFVNHGKVPDALLAQRTVDGKG